MLPLFPQELSTSCVAACVRMVLASLGHSLSEAEIRSRCGYSRLGMQLNQVAAGLSDLPVTVEFHNDWSVDDLADALRQSLFPIVGVDLRYIDGLFAFHAVVVSEISSRQLTIHDPRQAHSPRQISQYAFEDAWENADHECLVIRARLVG